MDRMRQQLAKQMVEPIAPMGGFATDLDEFDDDMQGGYVPALRTDARRGGIYYGDEQLDEGLVVGVQGVAKRRIRWATNDEKRTQAYPLDEMRKPLCRSQDAVKGAGYLVDNGEATGDCATCPLGQWEGKVPPVCTEQRVLLVMMPDGRQAEIVFAKTAMADFRAILPFLRKEGIGRAMLTIGVKTVTNASGTYDWQALNVVPVRAPAQRVPANPPPAVVLERQGDVRTGVYRPVGEPDISDPPPMPPPAFYDEGYGID